MKQIRVDRYGEPASVARCCELPDVGAPGPGEAVIDVLAFPINPADQWFCRGQYRLRPPLPATPGAECVGRVVAVGAGVHDLAAGMLVINLQRENWAQRRRVRAADLVPVPADLDRRQAAMLRINPPTAALLLSDVVDLSPGDWVLQNVANSSVGRLLIRLARARGLRTINVVRRDAPVGALMATGADHCLVDGADLAARVREACSGAPVKLGIDAVGGDASARIAAAVSDAGTVCHYGSMSGEDPRITRADLLYRGVRLEGFLLGRALARRSADAVRELYADLARSLRAGLLDVPVAAVYPIESIGDALRHAERGERDGKILVAPNGVAALDAATTG